MTSIVTSLFISCFVVFHFFFNPRKHTHFHPPTVVQGAGGEGSMEPLPGVFDMLQYFETILPLVESLSSS